MNASHDTVRSAPRPEAAAPLQDFARCHAGITARLAQLAGLPALLAPAAQARQVASEVMEFFRVVVREHHAEEEHELFPAVLASAQPGEEHATVSAQVDRLVREHREIEALWTALEPTLAAVAKGRDTRLDEAAVAQLVQLYADHARSEEQVFLPMARLVLGRRSDHLAALGLALHLRRVMPEVLGTGFHV